MGKFRREHRAVGDFNNGLDIEFAPVFPVEFDGELLS